MMHAFVRSTVVMLPEKTRTSPPFWAEPTLADVMEDAEVGEQ